MESDHMVTSNLLLPFGLGLKLAQILSRQKISTSKSQRLPTPISLAQTLVPFSFPQTKIVVIKDFPPKEAETEAGTYRERLKKHHLGNIGICTIDHPSIRITGLHRFPVVEGPSHGPEEHESVTGWSGRVDFVDLVSPRAKYAPNGTLGVGDFYQKQTGVVSMMWPCR